MSMSEFNSPQMSVVIVTPDDYESIRKTIRYLRDQTVRDRLELIIVATSAETFKVELSELKDFFRHRVIGVGKIGSIASANAAGLRQATAPVVAFVEEHSYPDPEWAEALIKAHQQSWAAVGPVMRNANPERLISWADFLISYGRWVEPALAGVIDHLPGHNSSYKRQILLDYGAMLEGMLEAESVLHWDFGAKHYQLYLEPAAKTSHLNFERLSSWVSAQFHSGRLFAITRAKRWSLLRRLSYIGGTPLIPMVRLWRILRQLHHSRNQRHLLPWILPALILGLVVNAAGEMAGLLLGAGNAKERIGDLEFHRERHLNRGDSKLNFTHSNIRS
jgi:glycosyltransferase involved in cell wall biosynthesis